MELGHQGDMGKGEMYESELFSKALGKGYEGVFTREESKRYEMEE